MLLNFLKTSDPVEHLPFSPPWNFLTLFFTIFLLSQTVLFQFSIIYFLYFLYTNFLTHFLVLCSMQYLSHLMWAYQLHAYNSTKASSPVLKSKPTFFFFFFWQRIALIKIPLTTQTQYDTIKIIIILYKLTSPVGSSFSAKANVFQSVVFRLALLAPLGNVL